MRKSWWIPAGLGLAAALGLGGWLLFGRGAGRSTETRYPSKIQSLHNGETAFEFRSVYARYDQERREYVELLYGFFTRNIAITETNDAALPPAARGVHWVHQLRDGLWLNGRKVVLPEGCRIIAIRDDGTVAPVALGESDLETLTKNFGALYDRALWEKVAPAFEPTKP